ncbi:MAG: TIGR01777 family oxidoreductase [Terrimicrobiaceae bacterium]|nr:TIGR01777 family oxidoreductase [Terrimicrobiaceae bacterium]
MSRIGILGATGFVGGRLADMAAAAGHEVVKFSRSAGPGFRSSAGVPDLTDLDAVVNLAGESVLGLWTAEKKRRIRESRTDGTRRIVSALKKPGAPRVFISASAVGYYGNTGDTLVDESSGPGSGFLAETCVDWEREVAAAGALGVRTVTIRIGFVLGNGGAMRLIRPVFQAGLGGNLGNGRQWMSCVHVDDVAGLILWAWNQADLSGAVNAVMPEPVRNADFTRAVAIAVNRPAVLPAPAFAIRLALGNLSSLLLDSSRVAPRVAIERGYPFRYPDLPGALQSLGKPK